MIIQNGFIEFAQEISVGIDPKTGYPVKGKECWSLPIPCQWFQNRSNLRAMSQGEHYSEASCTVLIEDIPLPDGETIRLKDLGGKVMGTFTLSSFPEYLESVGQIKLTIQGKNHGNKNDPLRI